MLSDTPTGAYWNDKPLKGFLVRVYVKTTTIMVKRVTCNTGDERNDNIILHT